MIENTTLEIVKNKLVETYNPYAIYLFGSYAWGKPDDDSDLDLLIIVDSYHASHYKMLVAGHKSLMHLNLSKDLLLLSREDFEDRADDTTTLCYKIKREGKKIYSKI